mmetsp:Transcript_24117/g.52127  ORF Transcript_24117/g.52127 Transcript_24117/m.52127 type:complete len:130 (-) Transcript_24117:327-716(-)
MTWRNASIIGKNMYRKWKIRLEKSVMYVASHFAFLAVHALGVMSISPTVQEIILLTRMIQNAQLNGLRCTSNTPSYKRSKYTTTKHFSVPFEKAQYAEQSVAGAYSADGVSYFAPRGAVTTVIPTLLAP